MLPVQPKKIWPWVVTIVLVIFVVQSPEAAAALVAGVIGLLATGADALGAFVVAL